MSEVKRKKTWKQTQADRLRKRTKVRRMREVKEMSFGEIAEALGITRGGAFQLYRRSLLDAPAGDKGDGQPSARG